LLFSGEKVIFLVLKKQILLPLAPHRIQLQFHADMIPTAGTTTAHITTRARALSSPPTIVLTTRATTLALVLLALQQPQRLSPAFLQLRQQPLLTRRPAHTTSSGRIPMSWLPLWPQLRVDMALRASVQTAATSIPPDANHLRRQRRSPSRFGCIVTWNFFLLKKKENM